MEIPNWLLRMLPMWDYICPKCRKEVKKNSHKCVHCGEQYGIALRVPPKCLKNTKELERYVHEHIFPRISVSQRNYLTQFFTILFSDGFESNDFSAWTNTVGAPAVEAAHPHHGTYNMITDAAEYCVKTFGASAITYFRFYAQFSVVPAGVGQVVTFAVVGTANWNEQTVPALEFFGGQAVFSLYVGDVDSTVVSTKVPIAGKYYCIEVLRDVTNDINRLWIDGVLEVDRVDAMIVNATQVSLGQTFVGGFAPIIYNDCAVVADAYIGPETAPKGTIAIHAKLAEII